MKLEAKKSHLSDLQLKREEVEDRIRNQLFDSETERRYIKEIKEQTSLLAGIRASTEKKHDLEAEIEGGIERDSTLITELIVGVDNKRLSLKACSMKYRSMRISV